MRAKRVKHACGEEHALDFEHRPCPLEFGQHERTCPVSATRRKLAILAIVSALSALSAGPIFGKITEEPISCSNPAGQQPSGQQPGCQNDNLTQESENQNPAGHAPGGHN